MKLGISGFVLLALSVPSVAAAETFVCITEASVGFKYSADLKRWVATEFSVSDAKYTMKIESRVGAWKKFGANSSTTCSPLGDAGQYLCDGGFENVVFDSGTKRFQVTNAFPITVLKDSSVSDYTPNMQIGLCSVI